MRRARSLWFFGAALLCAGCSAPKVARDAEMARFQKEMRENQAALKVDFTKPLTLADCEAIALKNNLDYRTRLLQVRLQDEEVRLAMKGWLPKAHAEFDETHRSNDALTLVPKGAIASGSPAATFPMEDRNSASFSLKTVIPIFDFGATYLAWQSAKDARTQARLAVVRARQTLLRDVRVAYARYAAALRQEKLAESAVEAALEILRVAQSLEREGLNARADTAFVEASLAQAALQLALARSGTAELRLFLNELLSLPNGVPYTLDTTLPKLPPALTLGEIPQLEESALRLRPELHAEDLQRHIAANTVRKDIANFFPQLNGTVDFNWSTQSAQVNPTFVTVGFNAAEELLDGGEKIFRYREAKKNVTAEKERALLVALAILYDVDLRALQVLRANDVLLASDVLVSSQEALLQDVRNRFREGLESGANAARALAELRAAELQQDRARTDCLTLWFELQAAALSNETAAPALATVNEEGKVN